MEEWGFSAGDEVELRGLSKLELNGQRGTVLPLEFPEQAQQLGRLAVMLHSGKQLSLKVGNLHKVKAEINTGGDLGAEWSASLRPGASRPLRAAAAPGRELVVMTLNMQYLASFPQDPTLARRRLVEITSAVPRPDVICVQEGLEGIDLFGQVGYSKLISSAVKAHPLRECLYDDPGALGAVPSVAHQSLMVNELYLRSDDCLWEAQSTGVDQISSSSLMVAHGGGEQALVARSAVWARLGLKGSTEGPFVYVLNTQMSGSRIEDELFLSQLGDERRRQAARLVDLFSSRSAEDDLGIIVGDFGAVSGPFGSDYPEEAEAPLQTLEDVGWSLVYDKDAVPASCLFGFLADFMATSQKVTPRSVEALATADVIGEAQLEVPISDHKAIKVAFPLPALVASRTKPIAASGLQELPVIGFGSHFMPEDLTERVSDQDFYRRVDELTQAALQEALAAGVRLIDSSNRHMNQQSIGRALETALKQEALTRGEVFLCGRISKCKDREQVRSEVDMLLSELQVDYVDLLVADCPPEQVPAAWPWIEEVAREGRTRFLGVSNFDLLGPKVCVEVFRKFLAGAKMPPAVLAMEVHPLNTNEEMSDLCQSMGIQVLAYSPLGAPHKVETYLKVLTKSDAREMRPLLKVPELQLLQSIANRHDATAAQVALRWNLQRGHCIVPKSWNPNHILENTKLFSFQLTMEEMASITKLNKGVRSERFFQASFSTAAKALPQMTRDAHDECRKILNKIRGPGGSVLEPGSLPQGLEPVPLPEGVARRGGDDGGLTGKVDWEKLGFHRPVEEEPGFWRRMGLATGKGLDGKGKGKGGTSALLKDGLPVGGKGVPRPAMVGYR